MNNYKNKTILITGASSGIGECFANTLNLLGARLILTARSKDKLEDMASSMNNAIAIPGDLSNKNFPKELYATMKAKKIRRMMRANGFDTLTIAYQYIEHANGNQTRVLDPNCGRAVYQNAKRDMK